MYTRATAQTCRTEANRSPGLPAFFFRKTKITGKNKTRAIRKFKRRDGDAESESDQ